MLSELNISILKKVLEEICGDDKVATCSDVHKLFEQRANTGLELYKFRSELSKLISSKVIKDYEIKVGRGGGVRKIENTERVSVVCSTGNYEGLVEVSKLAKFLKGMGLRKTNKKVKKGK